MTAPTTRQAEYLAFIQAFTERWGYPPSFEEIGRQFQVSTPSVNNMIKTLEGRGFLTRIPGAARSLRVLIRTTGTTPTDAKAAARIGALIIERLVPVLRDLPTAQLSDAVEAVAEGVDVACAGASDAERKAARRTLADAVSIATGHGPVAYRPRWVKTR